MVLVAFHSPVHEAEPWREAMAELLPEARLLSLEEAAGIDEESYAVVLYHPHGSLAKLPKLKAILSIAAGVDHLIADPTLPDVPIYRQTDQSLQRTMVEYALMAVLMHHRDMPQYIAQQPKRLYEMNLPLKLAHHRRVAVLGLGNLGHQIAQSLQNFGFHTMGWARTTKKIANVTTYAGQDQLGEMLQQTDILINVLPLTPETQQIINTDFLAKMPKGASIVNIGRGDHINEQDLLQALDREHIHAAILDVQANEPLPENDPLWQHQRVIITPHVAGDILMETAIPDTLQKMTLLMEGKEPSGLYQRKFGY